MAFVLAVTNQKGGVGKTTTAVNIAAQLAMMRHKVMLIDLDPQGNATSSLGVEKNDLDFSLYDVFSGNVEISEVVQTTNVDNLYVLPATTELAQTEVDLVNQLSRESFLSRMIANIDTEVIIIDCPPALGLLTINALTAADGVLIPVQAEYFALEGLGQLLQTIQLVKTNLNSKLEIFGVVLTMFTKRTVLSEQVQKEVSEHFKDKLFKTVIPRNVRLAEAPSYGKTIFEHDRWSKGAKAYKALASEIEKRANLK